MAVGRWVEEWGRDARWRVFGLAWRGGGGVCRDGTGVWREVLENGGGWWGV